MTTFRTFYLPPLPQRSNRELDCSLSLSSPNTHPSRTRKWAKGNLPGKCCFLQTFSGQREGEGSRMWTFAASVAYLAGFRTTGLVGQGMGFGPLLAVEGKSVFLVELPVEADGVVAAKESRLAAGLRYAYTRINASGSSKSPLVKQFLGLYRRFAQTVADELAEKCTLSVDESEDFSSGTLNVDHSQAEKSENDKKERDDEAIGPENSVKGFGELETLEEENDIVGPTSFFHTVTGSTYPPPPPIPPPKPLSTNSRRYVPSESNAARIGSSRRTFGWPGVSSRSSPTGSRPSSPRSHCEGEGYNSADEQGLEVRKMLEDGNCLFRAVADQVYGDSELYDLVRQMCIDYMERERDHFTQFITEGFTSYCKRKRRDKVYGNNIEIQALSEMYNRPIHIYSYSTEPINIFHGSYNTDTPPIRLSYHHGNHYNSLVDPRRMTIGAGLGFSSLQGRNVDKDQVKAAIKAQQDQQIDNALLAEGRFYSDLELTEKEIERMVMEASRNEYLADDKFKQQISHRESSTSRAEPSSSAARPGSYARLEGGRESSSPGSVVEAYSIFGDDVDSMVCYLLEMSSNGR
ncbi:OTU-like cysteine protease family protein, partial [Striga asiatica]